MAERNMYLEGVQYGAEALCRNCNVDYDIDPFDPQSHCEECHDKLCYSCDEYTLSAGQTHHEDCTSCVDEREAQRLEELWGEIVGGVKDAADALLAIGKRGQVRSGGRTKPVTTQVFGEVL